MVKELAANFLPGMGLEEEGCAALTGEDASPMATFLCDSYGAMLCPSACGYCEPMPAKIVGAFHHAHLLGSEMYMDLTKATGDRAGQTFDVGAMNIWHYDDQASLDTRALNLTLDDGDSVTATCVMNSLSRNQPTPFREETYDEMCLNAILVIFPTYHSDGTQATGPMPSCSGDFWAGTLEEGEDAREIPTKHPKALAADVWSTDTNDFLPGSIGARIKGESTFFEVSRCTEHDSDMGDLLWRHYRLQDWGGARCTKGGTQIESLEECQAAADAWRATCGGPSCATSDMCGGDFPQCAGRSCQRCDMGQADPAKCASPDAEPGECCLERGDVPACLDGFLAVDLGLQSRRLGGHYAFMEDQACREFACVPPAGCQMDDVAEQTVEEQNWGPYGCHARVSADGQHYEFKFNSGPASKFAAHSPVCALMELDIDDQSGTGADEGRRRGVAPRAESGAALVGLALALLS